MTAKPALKPGAQAEDAGWRPVVRYRGRIIRRGEVQKTREEAHRLAVERLHPCTLVTYEDGTTSMTAAQIPFYLYWRATNAALARSGALGAAWDEIRPVWLHAVPPTDAAATIITEREITARWIVSKRGTAA